MTTLSKSLIPNSSTREALNPDGYPENGEIEQTIRSYRSKKLSLYEQGLCAIETGCGNCQEMAFASGLLLIAGGVNEKIKVAEFGVNHAFLIVDNYIVDPWSDKYFPFPSWRDNLCAYGGSIKEGVMKGRVISADHFELEDEKPEVSKTIPANLEQCLASSEDRIKLKSLIEQALLRTEPREEKQLNTNFTKNSRF